MDVTVKAYLSRRDGSTEVRRLPLTVGGSRDITGLFDQLTGQLVDSFPGLVANTFIVSWKDTDGDYILMSTDEEFLEALSEMENRQLKVFLTETPEEVSSVEAAAMFPIPSRRSSSRPRGPWMRVSEAEAVQRSVKDDKGWKTSLRDLVPSLHRRWAKDYIRKWRQGNLQNGTMTGSSDGERGQKVTDQEAGVPNEYVTYLDTLVFRLHKNWAQEKPGKVEAAFEEAKKSVPEAFQNWVKWYLKTTFGPNRTPRFKRDKKTTAGKDSQSDDSKSKGNNSGNAVDASEKKKEDGNEKKAWKKEWKARRKQIKNAVPEEHRKWSEAFIRQWRLDHLSKEEKSRYQSDNSSSSADEKSATEEESNRRNAALDAGGVPDDYLRYLSLFLTQWHANQGDKLPDKDVKGAAAELKQITDAQVPPAYRKWVNFYVIRVLGRRKKDRRQEEEVNNWRCYYRWMLTFQRKWMDRLASGGATSSEDELDGPSACVRAQTVVMKRLQNIIDSDVEYDNELPVPAQRKPPAEFRYWALPILQAWDCTTVGFGLEPATVDAAGGREDVEQQDLPPAVYSWMSKSLARSQMKKLRAEINKNKQKKAAASAGSSKEGKQAKAEGKAA